MACSMMSSLLLLKILVWSAKTTTGERTGCRVEKPSAAPRRIADKLGVSARLARSGRVDWNN